MEIDLIPMTEKDRAFFRQAHHVAYRKVIESMFGWDEKMQDMAADRDFDGRSPHIIRWDGNDVGVIGWQDKNEYIWFGPIFILPPYQSKGIGTALIMKFMKMATDSSKTLKLQTLKENTRAKKLYEGLGFTVASSDEIHWQLTYGAKEND
ncbi:MAG: GNAT family N-acetyltransferase [Alphaproteobacteria bacterium]|nr:GNAT family N-acetyltransferase [Alphaproteobacteria bacterium]